MVARLILYACLAVALLTDEVRWIKHDTPPRNALSAGNYQGSKIYVCRAKLPDGVHPGQYEKGACLIPQKGKAERFAEFEFAVGGKTFWSPKISGKPVVAGKQFGKVELLICRRRDAAGVWVGKAYLTGPHAGHCYVSVGRREVDLTDGFEILQTR